MHKRKPAALDTTEGLASRGSQSDAAGAHTYIPEEQHPGRQGDRLLNGANSGPTRNSLFLKQKQQQCHTDLYKLLQKIQGLPANLQSLPLEITVFYNMVIFHVNVTGGFMEEYNKQIEGILSRVLEATSLGANVPDNTGLWQRVLHAAYPQEVSTSLHRLAGLQGALWLAEKQLQEVHGLFQLLAGSEVSVSADSQNAQKRLLSLLRAWRAPEERESLLTVQPALHVKDVLFTCAAFLQGIHAMESCDLSCAVDLLQEAAEGLCSSGVLAQIYTCLGCCFHKMEKPQTALQYWKKALQVDFQCLSALYHSSCVYNELGKTDAELEALHLLYKALLCPGPPPASPETHFLIRTELILNPISLTCSLQPPNARSVKYLIAKRCLQSKRVEEAVENYLDLLAMLQDGDPQEGLVPGPAPLPRIPELFLETAASLLEEKRYQDTVTVCEEVINNTSNVIPGRLTMDRTQKDTITTEQLHCILWASSAHLYQGQAQGRLGDHKESVTEFTRCINLLLKVEFINPGNGDIRGDSSLAPPVKEERVLGILKAAAFLGRARQFLELKKHKEALLNAQLSLQAAPAYPEAAVTLLRSLVKLDRKMEAASHLERFQNNRTSLDEQWEAVKRDLPLHLFLHIKDGFPLEDSLIKELQESSELTQTGS
ncbi:Fanconi anemia group G protein [Rhinophrynus dorsalis]